MVRLHVFGVEDCKFNSRLGCLHPVRVLRLDLPMLSEPTADTIDEYEGMLARTSPGSIRSASGDEEPGHPDKKWATGTRSYR